MAEFLEKVGSMFNKVKAQIEQIKNDINSQSTKSNQTTTNIQSINEFLKKITDALPSRFLVLETFDSNISYQEQVVRMQTQSTNNNA